MPFIQHMFGEAKIVPIIVPSAEFDLRLGTEIGDIILDAGDKSIVCIASTDLTHYGPRYGFSPQGTGPEAIKWAKEVNDSLHCEHELEVMHHYGDNGVHYCPTMFLACRHCMGIAEEPEPYECNKWGEK